MSTATVFPATPLSNVTTLMTDDGMLVRLSGVLAADASEDLRASLLRPRPVGCDDVIVDAADVVAVEDEALAILMAACAWAGETGGRFSYSRVSEPLRQEVEALDLAGAFPLLTPLG